MKQWEYKTVFIARHEVGNKLNELGLEGWDLLSVSRAGPGSTGLYYFLQRPLE